MVCPVILSDPIEFYRDLKILFFVALDIVRHFGNLSSRPIPGGYIHLEDFHTMPLNPTIGVYQNQPTNVNFLSTHRFRVVLRRAPSLVYFVQECNLPGMSMGNATYPNPLVDIPVPGDKVKYDPFIMTFPVDEDMKTYREVADWFIGLGFPKQFGQYKDLAQSFDGIRSDISLMILDSAHQPQHIVNFIDAFPISISDIHFDTKATDSIIPLVTATFLYTYWEFDDVNANTTTVTPADRINP